jgi:hypothetical protein
MTRKFLANVFLVLASVAVMGLVGEFVVRAALKDQTVLYPRYHTDYRYGEYTIRG